MSKRILSLLPAATEIVYFLGGEKDLVGVSGDCDYPKIVKKLPQITTSFLPANITSGEIDSEVRKRRHQGQSVFHIDEKLLTRLHPDVILTQELCSVCAIAYTQVKKAVKILSGPHVLVSLEPESVEDVYANILTVAAYTNAHKEAEIQIQGLKNRIHTLRSSLAKRDSKRKPSVLVIEWLDPLMVAGHWVPQMITYAGGRNLITHVGEKSTVIDWEDVIRLNPDYLIISPCGFTIERTKKELDLITRRKNYSKLSSYKRKGIVVVDGNAYLTRPGPRLIDGIEIFSEIFYPSLFARKHNKNAWQVAGIL
jgi:iron complex transport system substrate-binding protein